MSDESAAQIESMQPPEKPRLGLGLVGLALIVPVISGVLLCFVRSVPVALSISAATVIATAALVSVDASRLGQTDLSGRRRESAGLLFVAMCLLWIVAYPVAFFRRSAFGSPHLGFWSLFVAAFFAGAPFIAGLVLPAQLPSCTSEEVKQVLDQVIRSTSVGATAKSIDGHREVRFDRDANVRHGECVARTDFGDISVRFIVEWQDRDKGLFQVRLAEPELPSCTSAEVKQVLDQVIRSTPAGATTKSIDGHREVRFDRDANVRYGECVAHTDFGDVPVRFIVEWQDRDKGLFQVLLVESHD